MMAAVGEGGGCCVGYPCVLEWRGGRFGVVGCMSDVLGLACWEQRSKDGPVLLRLWGWLGDERGCLVSCSMFWGIFGVCMDVLWLWFEHN